MRRSHKKIQSLRHCFLSWLQRVATLWFVSCCWTLWPMCISGVLSRHSGESCSHCQSYGRIKIGETKNHWTLLSMVKNNQHLHFMICCRMGGQFDSICMHTLPLCGPLNGGRPGEIHILDRHFGQTAILFCVYVGFVLIRLPCGWIGASICFLAVLSPLWWSRSMSVAEHPMFAELPCCWVGLNKFFLEQSGFFWFIIISIHFSSHFRWFTSHIIALTALSDGEASGWHHSSKSGAEGIDRGGSPVWWVGLFWNGKKHKKKDGVLHTKVTKAWKMVNSSKFYVFMA